MHYYGTLGPSACDLDTLKALFASGMSGVRLNLSHRGLNQSKAWIDILHAAKADCELLIDLNGPELRLGDLKAPIELKPGDLYTFQDLPDVLSQGVDVGDQLLVDDGRLLFEVIGPGLKTRVLRAGTLQSHKSVAVVGKSFPVPTLTQADLDNIALIRTYGVTAVMLPFVRNSSDIHHLRQALAAAGAQETRILAKIENREGVLRLPEFIEEVDEVVIARGDLGQAYPLYDLIGVQKDLAVLCRQHQKPFMVVTQLLQSMIENEVPTRAEVSDIFNAVLDGASSLMVTGEMAIGKHPVEVMDYLVKTAQSALTWKQKHEAADHF